MVPIKSADTAVKITFDKDVAFIYIGSIRNQSATTIISWNDANNNRGAYFLESYFTFMAALIGLYYIAFL